MVIHIYYSLYKKTINLIFITKNEIKQNLKNMIKEAVKEAIQEELKDILLEAVKAPKASTVAVVQESVSPTTPTNGVTNPTFK